jgi:hypothetical protein
VDSADTAITYDEAVMTDLEDLLATIEKAIELLDSQSGDSRADELKSMGGEVPVDASPTSPAGSDDRDFAEKFEGVVADLEETINNAAGSDNSDLAEFLEGVVADFEKTIDGPDGAAGPSDFVGSDNIELGKDLMGCLQMWGK